MEDGSKNTYPLEHTNNFIDSPRGSTSEGEEISFKSKTERLNEILRNNHIVPNAAHDPALYTQSEIHFNQGHHQEGHVMPSQVHRKEFKPTSQEQVPEHVEEYSCIQQSPDQDVSENVVSQDVVPAIQSVYSPHKGDTPQTHDAMDQERASRTVLKKVYGGRIDNEGKGCFKGRF